jgi:2-dehydropantoate 2-reductase
MRIAIVGAGAIGSAFAYQLATAGHAVTAVARGSRLAQLQEDQAIVLVSGERAPLQVAPALDLSVSYDLVLVTVLAPQVAALVPGLARSNARTVMFMFNTFEALDELRSVVGVQRFAFGFPAGVFSLLRDGKIQRTLRSGTTCDDATWAEVFTDAGIPTVVEPDMHSWLRTHAALVVPLMAIGVAVQRSGAGITWSEASTYAAAMDAGFGIVRDLGHPLKPESVAQMSRLPRWLVRSLLWALSRTKTLRDLGLLGPSEARMLVDMMATAAPGKMAPLLAIRP